MVNLGEEPSVRSLLMARPDHFWSSSRSVLAGWGTALSFDPGTGPGRYRRAGTQLRQWAEATGQMVPTALASFTFDPELPGSVVIVPRQTVTWSGGSWARSTAEGEVASPLAAPPADDADAEEAFVRRVQVALNAIREGEVSKVVMARSVAVEFPQPLNCPAILGSLAGLYPHGHTFSVAGLIGSSPELLIERRTGRIRSVALAGSAAAEEGDGHLTSSAKEAVEHRITADWVESRLHDHASGLTRSNTEVMAFGPALHLATAFEGAVDSDEGVLDLLRVLHPTPAVGGFPEDAAMTLIRAEEGAMRGRYGGPVGWFDSGGDGEWAIAIRCALVDGTHARLFAGAGIVAGSDPAAELAETDYKLKTVGMALAAGQEATAVS